MPAAVTIDNDDLLSSPLLQPELDLTIGTHTDDARHQFGIIGGVALDGAGRIYVLDPYSYRVRVYDRSGTFIRDIGRRGQGPGEFTRPHGPVLNLPGNGIAVTGDTLWVLDDRVIAFDTAGSYLTESPPEVSMTDAVSIAPGAGGLLVTRTPFLDTRVLRYRFQTYDARSQSVDNGFEVVYELVSREGGLATAPLPLPNIFFDFASNGGVYVTVGDSFHIRRYNKQGHGGDGSSISHLGQPLQDYDNLHSNDTTGAPYQHDHWAECGAER